MGHRARLVRRCLCSRHSPSLLLAFLVFRHDRSARDRTQIDRLGVWGTTEPAWADEIGTLKQQVLVRGWARNSSGLPIRVEELRYEVHTRWRVAAPEWTPQLRVWQVVPGANTDPLAYFYEFTVPPSDNELDVGSFTVDLSGQAPSGEDVGLAFSPAPRVVIKSLIAIDNAGRRWLVEPGRRGPAQQLGAEGAGAA
jgi:hypothetical protein